MSRSKSSGYTLKSADAPIIFGMVARGDRDHDIAAWFGVNQGRIAEVKDGSKFGSVAAAASSQLPPRGAPGVKGRRLRGRLESAFAQLGKDGVSGKGFTMLAEALSEYDKNEA
jgi:hypothetical protein